MKGRLELHPNGHVVAKITLSRRNLTTLLDQLNRTADGREATIWRALDDGFTLVLTAEEDTPHYVERDARTIHPKSGASPH